MSGLTPTLGHVDANSQGLLDDMPRRLWSCTPTRLDTWLSCPRRYRFTYLDRRDRGRPWAHNSLGITVHNALRDWWSEPLETRTPQAAADLVRRLWISDGFRDSAHSEQWKERAAAYTATYVETVDPTAEPAGVERTVSVPTHGMALSGRVDRIDRRVAAGGDDHLVVVDYKTGRRALTEDDARSSLALAVYVAAVRRTLRRPTGRVELHHVPTARVVGYDHTEESLERQLRRAAQIAEEASAADETWKAGLSGKAEAARDGVADAVEAIDSILPQTPPSTRNSSPPWSARSHTTFSISGDLPGQGKPR